MESRWQDDSRCKTQTEAVSMDAAAQLFPAFEKGQENMQTARTACRCG